MVKFQINHDVYRNFTIGVQWDSLMSFNKLMGISFNPDMHREITFKIFATECPAGGTESAL